MTYRLSNSMPNQSRSHQTEKLKRKYFFIVEGAKTEVIYFNALANSIKKENLAEVLVLERIKETESNQLKITQAIEKYIQQTEIVNSDQDTQLKKLLIEMEEERANDEQAIKCLTGILGSKVDDLFVSELGSIKEQLYTLRTLRSYDETLDYVCIIIDRDHQSFKEQQFDEVIQICENNKFLLGITNPNFEFYLLLHLTNAMELDEKGIRLNYNVSNKYKYVQKQLSEYMQSEGEQYRKNEYNANFFLERFPTFEKHINNYTSENKLLKYNVGSSLHYIVKQLI